MAMLQRRFASSIYAVRRTLERMKEKREKILSDPAKYRQEQINRRLPDDFDDLPDEEQQELLAELEETVASYDPNDLRTEIVELDKLIRDAKVLEGQEAEVKVRKLRQLLTDRGLFSDPKHEAPALYRAQGHARLPGWRRPRRQATRQVARVGSFRYPNSWRMKIGDRDTPGTRIYAEREFRESCQVLVATEAAGEGINLQFCWLMINYDIPWNPSDLSSAWAVSTVMARKELPHLQFRHNQHPRGPRSREAFRAHRENRRRSRSPTNRQGLQCSGRDFPRQPIGENAARHVRGQPDDGGPDQAAHHRAGGH
jgi:hypothetical protein